LFFTLKGILGILHKVHSSCSGNTNLFERFGKINFRQALSGTIENCSWTFQSPFEDDVALVVRIAVISIRYGPRGRPFPIGKGPATTLKEDSLALIFPGGDYMH